MWMKRGKFEWISRNASKRSSLFIRKMKLKTALTLMMKSSNLRLSLWLLLPCHSNGNIIRKVTAMIHMTTVKVRLLSLKILFRLKHCSTVCRSFFFFGIIEFIVQLFGVVVTTKDSAMYSWHRTLALIRRKNLMAFPMSLPIAHKAVFVIIRYKLSSCHGKSRKFSTSDVAVMHGLYTAKSPKPTPTRIFRLFKDEKEKRLKIDSAKSRDVSFQIWKTDFFSVRSGDAWKTQREKIFAFRLWIRS